jgi:hypothetical protein
MSCSGQWEHSERDTGAGAANGSTVTTQAAAARWLSGRRARARGGGTCGEGARQRAARLRRHSTPANLQRTAPDSLFHFQKRSPPRAQPDCPPEGGRPRPQPDTAPDSLCFEKRRPAPSPNRPLAHLEGGLVLGRTLRRLAQEQPAAAALGPREVSALLVRLRALAHLRHAGGWVTYVTGTGDTGDGRDGVRDQV